MLIEKLIRTYNNPELFDIVVKRLNELGNDTSSLISNGNTCYSLTTKSGNVTRNTDKEMEDSFQIDYPHTKMTINELMEVKLTTKLNNNVLVQFNSENTKMTLSYDCDSSDMEVSKIKQFCETVLAFRNEVGRTLELKIGCRTFKEEDIKELLTIIKAQS